MNSILIGISIIERLMKLAEQIDVKAGRKKVTPAEERAAWRALERLRKRVEAGKGESEQG
jgi:hypothetical protein